MVYLQNIYPFKKKEHEISENDNIEPVVFTDADISTLEQISAELEKRCAADGTMTKGEVISFLRQRDQFPVFGEMNFSTCQVILYLLQYLIAAKQIMYKSTFELMSGRILMFNEAVDGLQSWIYQMICPQIRYMEDFTDEGFFPVCYILDSDIMQGTTWLIEFLKLCIEEHENGTESEIPLTLGKITFIEAVEIFENWFYDILIP